MPRQRTKGDAMASRGRKEGEGMVAAVLFVLRCAIESPKFHRSFGSYWQFLHIRNDGRNGLVATESRQILERMVQGEEKRKKIPNKKNIIVRIDPKSGPKGQQTPSQRLRLV